jgi:hypothetical protein
LLNYFFYLFNGKALGQADKVYVIKKSEIQIPACPDIIGGRDSRAGLIYMAIVTNIYPEIFKI